MPLYEYVCQECGARFERLVRGSADTQTIRCPRCESDTVARAFSTFATGGAWGGETAPACGPVG